MCVRVCMGVCVCVCVGVSVFIVIICCWFSTPLLILCPGFHEYFWYSSSCCVCGRERVYSYYSLLVLYSFSYSLSGLPLLFFGILRPVVWV